MDRIQLLEYDPTRYREQESFDYWEQRDPLIRFRNYLKEKGLWTDETEEELIEKTKEEIKQAAKEEDEAPKMKISDFLKNMHGEPGQNTVDQIKEYEAKESK